MQHNRVHTHSGSGFVFIELMLVVAIIGILAAVAIPAYQDYILKSKAAEWQVMVGPLKEQISRHFDYWGRLPADNASAGLAEAKAYHSRYVDSMEVRNGAVIVALRTENLRATDKPGSIVFFPELSGDKVARIVDWRCYSGAPPAGLASNPNLPTVDPVAEIYWRTCKWPKK